MKAFNVVCGWHMIKVVCSCQCCRHIAIILLLWTLLFDISNSFQKLGCGSEYKKQIFQLFIKLAAVRKIIKKDLQ